jgi:hypothetical protein
VLKPESFLEFFELPAFTRRWEQLKLDVEMDLATLQLEIMRNPREGKVIKGANRLRKMRFSPPRWRIGKSGALRVIYALLEDLHVVVLAVVYSKGEADDLSEAGKERLNYLVDEIGSVLTRLRSVTG